MIPMINVQSAPAVVVNTVGPFERPCETEFGRDSTDCAQISPLLELLEADVLLAVSITRCGDGNTERGSPHRGRNRKRLASAYPSLDLVEPSGFAEAEQIFDLGERELTGHRPLFAAGTLLVERESPFILRSTFYWVWSATTRGPAF